MLGIVAPSGVIVEGYSRLDPSWQTAARLRSGVGLVCAAGWNRAFRIRRHW